MSSAFSKFCNQLTAYAKREADFEYIRSEVKAMPTKARAFQKSLAKLTEFSREITSKLRSVGRRELSPAEKFAALGDFRNRVVQAIQAGELTAEEAATLETRLSKVFASPAARAQAKRALSNGATVVPLPTPGGPLQ